MRDSNIITAKAYLYRATEAAAKTIKIYGAANETENLWSELNHIIRFNKIKKCYACVIPLSAR